MGITLAGPVKPTEDVYIRGVVPDVIPDPGNGGAIQPRVGELLEITTAGAETRTLPRPSFRGQELALSMVVDGGDCVITSAGPVNQANHTRITFTAVGQYVQLVGLLVETSMPKVQLEQPYVEVFEWRVIVNDGATIDAP